MAGVLPLLWNMLVALRIWTKLRRSLLPGFREYYSLTPDPITGKVTVVAYVPSLGMPGLWSTDPSNTRLPKLHSEKKGPYGQLHASLLAMGMPLTAPSTAMMARNAMQDNLDSSISPRHIPRHRLFGRTWMSVADYCGMHLKKLHYDDE